eukprot:366402-Chlamydomonas_euryale.AAC.5
MSAVGDSYASKHGQPCGVHRVAGEGNDNARVRGRCGCVAAARSEARCGRHARWPVLTKKPPLARISELEQCGSVAGVLDGQRGSLWQGSVSFGSVAASGTCGRVAACEFSELPALHDARMTAAATLVRNPRQETLCRKH